MRIRLDDGRIVDAVDLQIVGPNTKVVDFPLNDGSKLEIQITVQAAFRATDEFNDVGEPVYQVKQVINARMRDIPEPFYGTPSKKLAIKPAPRGPEIA